MEHTKEPWIDEARTIAAQCWCTETTSHIEMDIELAEVFAKRIAAWMATGSQHATNESYWRDRALSAEQQRDELQRENTRLQTEAHNRSISNKESAALYALADVTEQRDELLALVESAFKEGFCAPATYNDTVLNDMDGEWEKSESRAAIAKVQK